MVQIVAMIAGFALGWYRAGKRGGNRLDKLQYGAAHGIAFFILGLFLTILADRLGLV